MEQSLGRVIAGSKTGAERFHQDGAPLEFDLLSFWRWSASDLLSNATRGILAEYLVARALGDASEPRMAWSAFDALAEGGVRVEVKSAAYLQSWHQERLSRITFTTRSTLAWDASTNLLAQERQRQADVYVFRLLDHQNKATVDPLNLAQWRFFVVSTERLNAAIGEQKSLGLAQLSAIGAEETSYKQLRSAVAGAASEQASS